ncbi:hypothetical protein GCM10011358_10220 [Sinisalibacter lacisalsi]|uniref:OmpA-like domain-containing protein n=2 Tax=Sinisalibacter lacisalsi TaxID=1526570 RepID=A0ABQ1QJ63_9RHOB|nr:hypothetical protein GCM10011358_10220 [Sinisalibacter lacisalsi]
MGKAVELDETEARHMFSPQPAPDADTAPVDLVTQDVEDLANGLIDDGRVVVDAIRFEADRDEILPQSGPALATIARLMNSRPELSLIVVGNSDGAGSLDDNRRLSADRAWSVVACLTGRHGIDPRRLRPAWAGALSPDTTNGRRAGLALNRFVELVEVIE